jgi:transcriptional regulator with XRE-family HTH domain
MAEIAKIIGERIRAYRTKAGLSQENLAERAGRHSTYIGQLERGEKNATLESIEKVARALDVSFETLFMHIISGLAQNESAEQCLYRSAAVFHVFL